MGSHICEDKEIENFDQSNSLILNFTFFRHFYFNKKMSLSKSKLLKIVDHWDESEDDFVENEDDDSDYSPIVKRVRVNPKNKKKTVKIQKPKKKSRESKTLGKNAKGKRNRISKRKKKIKKKKKSKYLWSYGHMKRFSIEKDIGFKGDVTLPEKFMKLDTPYEFFNYFFDSDVKGLILTESNKYAFDNMPEKRIDLSETDLNQYIGICCLMSVIQIPNIRRYWAPITGVAIIRETMSLNKFEQIRRQFHFNDNDNMIPKRQPNHDRLFKIRPLVSALIKRFQTVPLEQCLSVDEQICSTKARSSLKVYMPNKPHKWGYKLFVLSGTESGYCYFFEIFTGMENDASSRLPSESDLGSCANVVVRMLRMVPDYLNYKVCFDNYFSTVPLIVELSKRGIHSVGTIRKNRLYNDNLPSDKELLSLPRGSSLEMTTTIENIQLANVTWRDNKIVNLVSDYVGTDTMQSVKRFDKRHNKKVSIDCPNIIKEYNSSMGGVDLLDSFIGRQKIKIRSKKWYMRIFYHLLDITITNAWILYKRVSLQKGTPKNRLLCLADFRVKLGETLCKLGSVSRQVGRPSTEISKRIALKRKHHSSCPIPPKEVRLDKLDHFPMWVSKRVQCKSPKCKGFTYVRCSKCQINLCFNKDRNCYRQFHNS